MCCYDEDGYRDAMDGARSDAEADAYADMLREAGPCGGGGYVITPCSGRHAHACGGPDCDGGDEAECPGCEDCQPDDDGKG